MSNGEEAGVQRRTKSGHYKACTSGLWSFNSYGDVVNLPCGQWKCEACRKLLSGRSARRVRYGIALWPSDAYLWTFTMRGYVKTPGLAFHILRVGWDALRKAVQRAYGEFQYASFIETHPKRTGIAHVHCISLCPSPERIKDLAYRSGFGYMATELVIDGKGAANYVAKYVSKQGADMPRNFRRVRFSRAWPALPEPVYAGNIYPMQKGEGLHTYLRRISSVTGLSVGELFAIAQANGVELDRTLGKP